MDKNGKELISCIYDEIEDYGSNELLIVKKEKKYGVVDYQNNLIVPIEYDIVYSANNKLSKEGFIYVYKQVFENGYSTGESKYIEIP